VNIAFVLPILFLHQLPKHQGYEWQQVGTDLVLVGEGSFVISDILKGVID
jgi:Ni/Co efflux regulator RcnB